MNNLPQTYESIVQQRDALAAENANLKEVLSEIPKSLFQHVRGDTYEWQIRTQSPEKMIKEALSETPETDAFLADVRAQGVDAAIKHLHKIFDGTDYIGEPLRALVWLEQALRKGINDAQ